MLKKNSYITCLYLIHIVGMTACKKFVQIGPPSTQISAISVFNDNNAATAALTVIYSQMQTESWSMSQNSGLLSDELTSLSPSQQIQTYFKNRLLAVSNPSPGPWKTAYNYIYQANALLNGIIDGDLYPSIKNQLMGEAKFIRAFWNFYLVNCYGDIPLVLTTDYSKNSSLKRTPKEQIYSQIISDLKDAKELLNYNYVDESDTASFPERIRPNKATATAFLARVYLYTKDYADAETASAEILADTRYKLVHGLDSVFLKNSDEAIWQLAVPSPFQYNTVDGYYFILQAPPSIYSSANTATINSSLLNSFESNDKRKSSWIGSITTAEPDTTYYFPYKYKSISSDEITEYTMIFRLAEQYFIHAEALVMQNKSLTQAVADLNVIRERAGLDDYQGGLNPTSLMTAILQERRVELFTEWGHRWFDLIRTGNIDAVMSVVTPMKGGGNWVPQWALYPIPQSEINIDFNLSQNPGY